MLKSPMTIHNEVIKLSIDQPEETRMLFVSGGNI